MASMHAGGRCLQEGQACWGQIILGKNASWRLRYRLGEMLAMKKCILGRMLAERYTLRRTHDVSDECWGCYI